MESLFLSHPHGLLPIQLLYSTSFWVFLMFGHPPLPTQGDLVIRMKLQSVHFSLCFNWSLESSAPLGMAGSRNAVWHEWSGLVLALPQMSFVTSDMSLNFFEPHVHALLSRNDHNCSSYLLGRISFIKGFFVLGQNKNQYFFSSKWVCHYTRNTYSQAVSKTLLNFTVTSIPASVQWGGKGDYMWPESGLTVKVFLPFPEQSASRWWQKGQPSRCTLCKAFLSG